MDLHIHPFYLKILVFIHLREGPWGGFVGPLRLRWA